MAYSAIGRQCSEPEKFDNNSVSSKIEHALFDLQSMFTNPYFIIQVSASLSTLAKDDIYKSGVFFE